MKLENVLSIKRCPHCQIASPNISHVYTYKTQSANSTNTRFWLLYQCASCGGMLLASRSETNDEALEIFPSPKHVEECIPYKARTFLEQAINSLNAPSGSIMLSASAIDAMLKEKGYIEGSLNDRINSAAKNHLITEGMSEWAHSIRLEANEQRHADTESELPNDEDAQRTVDFALALAHFLFVLPERVSKGILNSKK